MRVVYSTKQKGDPAGKKYDHTSGEGYVAKQHGYYLGAMQLGLKVHLYVVEVLGGCSRTVRALLHVCKKKKKDKNGRDRTVYGKRSKGLSLKEFGFEVYHLREIAARAVFGFGYTICRGAKKRMGGLHRGGPGDTYGQLGEVQPTTAAVPTGAPRVWGQGQRE